LQIDQRYLLVPPGFTEVISEADLADRGGAIRAVATSDHPIEFSVLAAVAIPLTFHLARYAEKPISRQMAAIACLLSFAALPASVSRSGVVAIAAIFVIYALALKVRLLANVLIIGMAGLLAYKIVLPSAVNALWATFMGSQTDASILTRTEDYAAVGEQFREDPWFGLGLGGYPPTVYRFLDNQWLMAIVTGGVVGLAAMLLLTIGGVAGMTVALRNSRTPAQRDQVFAMGAAFCGIIVSSATFDLFSFQQATIVLFILFALLWTVRPDSDLGVRRTAAARGAA
jgi:O-antigen ligase